MAANTESEVITTASEVAETASSRAGSSVDSCSST